METIDGVILESKFPDLQYVIKGPLQEDWRDGIPIRRPKHIVLQFERYLCVLDDMIRQLELTEEDKGFVARQLSYELGRPDMRDFWVHEKPVVPPPWPTYNETHHNTVPQVAASIGLVAEALHYERFQRPGGPRESVVQKLEAYEQGDGGSAEPLVEEDALSAV